MKHILFALLMTPAFSLASTGEGGPRFQPGPAAGQVVLNCDSVRIYYGVSHHPMIPPPLLSSYGPVTSYSINGMHVYQNARFSLSFAQVEESFGPRHAFNATLTVATEAPRTVVCFKGPRL